MRLEMWKNFKRVALHERKGLDSVGQEKRAGVLPALIVDSPWLPGFVGISHLDYFTLPDQWMKTNLFLEERFPEIVFLPGFWVEYGMAAEPSGFGCKIRFWENSPPSVTPLITDMTRVSRLEIPDPLQDGLMPLILNLYRFIEKQLLAQGQHIKMVAARGPLAIAAHLRGLTEFLMDLKLLPLQTKELLNITTQTVIRWLQAQIHHLSEVEGIMVLDDVVGFLSPEDYLEFAHPYLREIFASFGTMVKVYHNDTPNDRILGHLAETGFHVFNFSHKLDMGRVYQRIGDRVCLMGNVPPLDILVRGNPEEVRALAVECIRKTEGGRALLLSAGGGASPGMPGENLDALVQATKVTLQ